MTDIQPGKVPTYQPSPAVSLSGYDDSDRTRFIFNGSQFVKAALEVSEPSFAYVTSASTNYKTVDGKYALVNGERYIPVAYGTPGTGTWTDVRVGFPITVSTSSITIWSTSYLSYYDSMAVSYSYDGSFYFDISGSSVSWSFESSEEQYPGESPPSGLYKYVIDLGASYSARYFKIHATHQTTYTSQVSSSDTTIYLSSTDGFPDQWLSFSSELFISGDEVGGSTTIQRNITYTGKTATSLTGVSFESSFSGSLEVNSNGIVRFKPSFAEDFTEIEFLTYTPTFEFWDTDGSIASSSTLPYDKYYDVAYDKDEDAYFTIRLNTTASGNPDASFTPSDDFNYSTSALDTTRWSEDEDAPNFQVNTASGTLDYNVSSDDARITTNYFMEDDFTAYVDLPFTSFSSEGARAELRGIDHAYNNLFTSIGITGAWPSSSRWEALHVTKTTDTTAGAASIYNLRIDTKGLDNSDVLSFVYNSSSNSWAVTSSISGTLSSVTPGSSYSDNYIKGLNIVHSTTPSNGVTIELSINYQSTSVGGSNPYDFVIGLSRTSSSLKCQYNEGAGLVDFVTYTDSPVTEAQLELFVDGDGGTADFSMDNFAVTGNYAFSDIPVFTVEALDASGSPKQIVGLTDSNGKLIQELDVINTVYDYNSYVGGKVQIATNSKPSGSGGAIYIKVGDELYTYNKSSLPLTTEDGSSAAKHTTGNISSTSVNAFAYNAYSNGDLCYITYDSERGGVYLKTMDSSTLSGTQYESLLDVSSADYPWAWDQNNYTTLYYIDSTNLKEYDMDENDVAFCNVFSTERIMSAGTSATSSVYASVLNVYGEPLSSKTVTFSVSSGGGAVSPSTTCTNASGIASTTYTIGSSVGNVTITAVASDASC